jgi:hypothetical protein
MMFPTEIPLRIKNRGGNIKLCFEIQDTSVFFFAIKMTRKSAEIRP